MKLFVICIGGAIGSGARYLLSSWTLAAFGPAFPFGTLLVNVIGSFFICAIMHLGVTANLISPMMRLFLTTGIMGGLTTYSTFDYETYRFTQQGAYGMAVLNVLLTLGTCFIAGLAGDGVARLIVRS